MRSIDGSSRGFGYGRLELRRRWSLRELRAGDVAGVGMLGEEVHIALQILALGRLEMCLWVELL